MVTIKDVNRTIRGLVNGTHPVRPFLCEGTPLGCKLALVGINPGTDTPFWPFWSLPYGCRKTEWLSAYRDNPKNRRNQTRPRIEILCKALAPIRCLELNMYPYYSRDEKSLSASLKDARIFEYMLGAVRPKVLFVFGSTPIAYLKNLIQADSLPKRQFTPCAYAGVAFDVYADSHLSRGWSHEQVRALGMRLKDYVRSL